MSESMLSLSLTNQALAVLISAICTFSPAEASAEKEGMTSDSGSGPIQKKLINRGWGAPNVGELRENLKLIENSPFDGVAIKFVVKDDEGKEMQAFMAGVNRPWKAEWFQPDIEILKKLKSRVVADSFFSLSLAAPPHGFADAFDDEGWKDIIEHFRIAAWVAKQSGLKGLMLDLEAYSSTIIKFAAAKQKDKSFDEYAVKVRQRGREMMQAMSAEYPDMTIFTLFLNSGAAMGAFGGDPRETLVSSKSHYNLMPAFINGWLDVVPPGITIVDGMEHSYPHSSEIAYLRRVNAARNTVLSTVAKENRAKYRAQVQAGLAIYMDAFLADRKDVHSDVFTDPPLEGSLTDRLRQSTMSALDAVDEYVWVFDEQYRFWPTSHKRVQPYYWDDFIPGAAKALKDAKDINLRQEAIAEREFQISRHKTGIRGIPMRNLVKDSGVELPPPVKKKDKEPLPEQQAVWFAESSSGVLQLSKIGSGNKGSLELKGTKDGVWMQTIEVKPQVFYKVQAMVRQIGKGQPDVRLVWQDNDGQTIQETTAQAISSPNEAWAPVETVTKAPDKAAKLVLKLGAKGQEAETDSIWYDDAEVYQIGVN